LIKTRQREMKRGDERTEMIFLIERSKKGKLLALTGDILIIGARY